MAQKQEKLYVITRSDLPIGDQAVQACHVVEAWKHNHPVSNEVNTIALLVVDSKKSLEALSFKLTCKGLYYTIFKEEDLGNELTALACLTDRYSTFYGLKKLGE